MKSSSFLCKFLAVGLLGLTMTGAFAQELVTNGTFEEGSFAGFTMVEDPADANFSTISNEPDFQNDGSFFAFLGTNLASVSTSSIFQDLSTVPGTIYTISFALAVDEPVTNFFEVKFGSTTVLSLSNVTPLPGDPAAYMPYSFQVAASDPTTRLQFNYRNNEDFFRLDSVSVVPEWSSTSYLALALVGGLFFYGRSRRTGKARLS